jgi:predicted Fe-S protein YdhL (DUF1289 family)
MDRKVLTPCIGVCKLKNNICIGCKRTIKEIKEAYDKVKELQWHLLKRKNHQQKNHLNQTTLPYTQE